MGNSSQPTNLIFVRYFLVSISFSLTNCAGFGWVIFSTMAGVGLCFYASTSLPDPAGVGVSEQLHGAQMLAGLNHDTNVKQA